MSPSQHTTQTTGLQWNLPSDATACLQPNKETLAMEEGRKENQSKEPDSLTTQENSQETRRNGPARHARAAGSMQAFTSLSPKALSAVLHQTARPGPDSGARRDPGPDPDSGPGASRDPGPGPSRDSGPDSGPGPSRDPPHLEQLQTELRDLRDQFGRMKSQHNKEIKLLMSELDEEKKIRLTLQMEVQRMKKHMSK
uniref:SH3 domain-containing kinase-binding protein 1 isoform X1 n=1 Tax=Gasterosteus aculeatus aculeatus TaxID=481459 RepID=UPI001A99B582|nr:SH3 domain-containing kinase-binding protein 1 isoform X1 [Gasterosteus aculeatus aculeatus]